MWLLMGHWGLNSAPVRFGPLVPKLCQAMRRFDARFRGPKPRGRYAELSNECCRGRAWEGYELLHCDVDHYMGRL